MKNHFEGATPEWLVKALLRPIRKPKAKPAPPPQRVVTTTTAPAAEQVHPRSNGLTQRRGFIKLSA